MCDFTIHAMMASVSRWFSTSLLIFATLAVRAEQVTPEAPPGVVTMEPFEVSIFRSSVHLQPYFRRKLFVEEVTRVRIKAVNQGSPAAKAGLVADMEVYAIQGVSVAGITEGTLEALIDGPFPDGVTLTVARRRLGIVFPRFDVFVPMRKSSPADRSEKIAPPPRNP